MMKGYITFLIVFIAIIIILFLNLTLTSLSGKNSELLKEEKVFYKTLHAKERIESTALAGSIAGWIACFALSEELGDIDCLEPHIADLSGQVGAAVLLNSLNYFLPQGPFSESYLCTNETESLPTISEETVKKGHLTVVGWHNDFEKSLPYISASMPVDAITALKSGDISGIVNLSVNVQIGKKTENGEGRFYYIVYSKHLNESRVLVYPLTPVELKLININLGDFGLSSEDVEEALKNTLNQT